MNEKLRIAIAEHAPDRAEAIKDSINGENINVQIYKLYSGEKLPNANEVDAVISGGGPMGVYEMNKPEYDFLNREAEFISTMIAQNKAVLGICLGHQLLSKILGSEVVKSLEDAEFGWSKITLNDDGKEDELFKGIDNRIINSFQYHQDAVLSLPKEARLLASSDKSKIQAIRYSDKPVWGLQFHPEIGPEMAQRILLSRKETLENLTGMDVFLSIQQGFESDHEPRKQIFYNFLNVLKGK